jgi:hypothetical protein
MASASSERRWLNSYCPAAGLAVVSWLVINPSIPGKVGRTGQVYDYYPV